MSKAQSGVDSEIKIENPKLEDAINRLRKCEEIIEAFLDSFKPLGTNELRRDDYKFPEHLKKFDKEYEEVQRAIRTVEHSY